MPIFEYRCGECGREFECLVRASDEAECPGCGNRKAQKLLSTPAAHTSQAGRLPIASACAPADAPPCGPGCCRLP